MKELIIVLIVCLFLAGGAGVAAPVASAGGLYRVSVLELPLKSAPFGLSQSVKTLKYGDQVVLQEPVPPRSRPLNRPAEKNRKQKQQEVVVQPSWFKVVADGTMGYLPLSSLVPAGRFDKQNSGIHDSQDAADAGKGFSESEDPDLAAVKGASGDVDAGTANYEGLDKIIAEYPAGDKQQSYREFRQQGKVGEFKQAEVKP